MKSRRTADKSAFRKPTRKSDLANMVTAMKCRRWHWYFETRANFYAQLEREAAIRHQHAARV
jgi:hypothetical protein